MSFEKYIIPSVRPRTKIRPNTNENSCNKIAAPQDLDGNIDYIEMKRKLRETEHTLHNLKKLEKEVLNETSDLALSVNEHQTSTYGLPVLQDGTGSLSSVPDSYSRFANHKMHSSTPGRQQGSSTPSDTNKICDTDNSSLSSSTSSRQNEVSNKHERKLLQQNQRLLLEVERLIGELHKTKLQSASFEKSAELAKKIPDLEDKVEGLIAETKAQDKALREAEKHLEESVKRCTDLQRKLDKVENDNGDLHVELERLQFAKKKIEEQRDEALHNVIEAQEALEDYQKRIKEKIKKMENFEDELQDKLTRITQERDDYLDQLSDIQSSVASQEAQINRLLNDVEKETTRRMEVEDEKNALQEQLKLLSCELDKLDDEMKEMKEIKKQKLFLETEMQEHRKLAEEIADLLIQVHHHHNKITLDDSGNFSLPAKYEFRMWHDDILSDAVLNTNNNGLEELNSNNNGLSCEGGTTMMAELRNLFTNMDGEIQRLRYDLKQRDADDRTYQNLHDELKVLMDKVESGVRANQELEFTVCALEDEKRTLNLKLDETLHSLAEQERQIQCLDTRLNERNHQVVCLQEDNSMKAQRLCSLEKDLDCCERRLKLAGSGSNESLEQLRAAEERIKELEEILKCKENSLQDMQNQIVKLQKDMRCQQQKLEKKAECLTQQVYEYQKQTDQLSSDNDSMRQKLAICNKASEECKRCLRAREDQIRCLDLQIEELKYTLEEKDKLHCKVLESYQQKICKSNEQIKNLECALMMCKNEVQMHLETMEKIKNHFECELSNRDGCIKHLQEELRKATEDLKCRTEENCNLEQTLADANTKLANSYNQLKSCDQNVLCLTEKLKSTENQMLKDKACYMKDTEELERRLAQALNSLQCTHDEIGKLKNFLQDKSSMLDCLQVEKNSLVRDLTKCKEVACCLQDKLGKMEKDNQELCRQLQQKMDCIRDMESVMCNKDQELKCCQRFIEELQDKLKILQDEINSSSGASASLQDKIKSCREELLCQSKMLCECEEALKRCQMELRDKCEEIRMQNCTIEELNCKLHERIARVDELEKAIENLNKDIDKRMKRVDEQLKKYECELCDKAKQIADLDDCLTRCQHNLNEKSNEACVLEQKNARLCSDWNACQLKLKECEETRECLGKALSEQRAENAELAQELRVNREHLQQKHQELVDAQQTLCACNRELERTRRECDDLRNCLSQRECEIQHLSEEKNCLVSKVAHLTCRLENETCQLQNQMSEMKCRLEKENESLRIYQGEIEENNACLLQKLSACQRQLSQVEKCCHQKLDCMNRELEDLNSKLADREDQIAQCKECLNLKDNEIMRLKLRLCSTDRCGDNCSNNHCMNNSNVPVIDISDVDSFKQDKMESPLLLTVSQPVGSITPRSTDDNSQLWTGNVNRNSTNFQLIRSMSKEDKIFEPDCQISNDSSSARNSLGASEVQERLRSNQIRQMEIERQLKCLEEETVEDIPYINIFQAGVESEPVQT